MPSHKFALFSSAHRKGDPIILPNIWDPIGALLLENLEFSGVATASAAIGFSKGFDDGQQISLGDLLRSVRSIADRTALPVSVDFERGYAESLSELSDNIARLIEAGAIGLNIEDSIEEGGALRPISEQEERIATIRTTAEREGVELFINARSDVYLRDNDRDLASSYAELEKRAIVYQEAGAHGFYPICFDDIEGFSRLADKVTIPLNALLSPGGRTLAEWKTAKASRISLGPSWLKIALTAMRESAVALQKGASPFPEGLVSSSEVRDWLPFG